MTKWGWGEWTGKKNKVRYGGSKSVAVESWGMLKGESNETGK